MNQKQGRKCAEKGRVLTETVIKSKRVENGRDIYLQEEKTKTDEK